MKPVAKPDGESSVTSKALFAVSAGIVSIIGNMTKSAVNASVANTVRACAAIQ